MLSACKRASPSTYGLPAFKPSTVRGSDTVHVKPSASSMPRKKLKRAVCRSEYVRRSSSPSTVITSTCTSFVPMSFWISSRAPSRVTAVSSPGCENLSGAVRRRPRMNALTSGRSCLSICHTCAPSRSSVAISLAMALSCWCKSITSRCRLSPTLRSPCVSCASAARSSPSSVSSARRRCSQKSRRAASSGGQARPLSHTGRAMVARSAASAASSLSWWRMTMRPSSKYALFTSSGSQAASCRPACASSRPQSGTAVSGAAACWAADCNNVR
jgi:hypothetical protein